MAGSRAEEAAARWAAELAAWAIPPEILAAAAESPYSFPIELFRVPDGPPPDTPSRQRALAALPGGGSVLDVGCGGGAASLALVPPAAALTGVDSSPGMLSAYAEAAAGVGICARTVGGSWPEVATTAGQADVVVCHHVAYNVADLPRFATALTTAAQRRVVLELTATHPWAGSAALWRRFHALDRPSGPTAALAVEVLRDSGIALSVERWQRPPRPIPRDVTVAALTRRLCLPPERRGEVAAALTAEEWQAPRALATLWWDA